MKFAYAGFDLMAPALQALCENNELLRLFTCTVDGVSETNDKVISLARRSGAPYTTDRITKEDIDRLVGGGCELLVSAGYYYRIPIDERLKMVNIHPSLLPYGRGAWPMPLMILDRLKESGVTVHQTEEGFDTGAILLQRRISLADEERLDTFMEKVNALLPELMRELTADLDALWHNAAPQGEGVYQEQPDPDDYVLNRTCDAEYADRVLRAFYGFSCVYEDAGGRHLLLKARAKKGDPEGQRYPLKDGYVKADCPLI